MLDFVNPIRPGRDLGAARRKARLECNCGLEMVALTAIPRTPANSYGTKLGNRRWETFDIAQSWLNSRFPMGRG
jgi:hypothetical protein